MNRFFFLSASRDFYKLIRNDSDWSKNELFKHTWKILVTQDDLVLMEIPPEIQFRYI